MGGKVLELARDPITTNFGSFLAAFNRGKNAWNKAIGPIVLQKRYKLLRRQL